MPPTPVTYAVQLNEHFHQQLAARQQAGQWRQFTAPLAAGMVDFTSNDYLGLSRHPQIIAAAQHAAAEWGVGSTGSRLLSGNHCPLATDLEAHIAHDKKQDAALVFATGYQANTTALKTLLSPDLNFAKPIVFCDRLNHASLNQGVLTSGAEWHRYRHLDMTDLEAKIQRYAQPGRPLWIITESVFSMDGDVADVTALQTLAERYNLSVYVDEAHATGLLGPDGYGLTPSIQWNNGLLVAMGTFSKALGNQGAYIASHQSIIDTLINHCPGLIYTTAPSPIQLAATKAAWTLLPHLSAERAKVLENSEALRRALQAQGWSVLPSGPSAIVPVLIGDNNTTVALKQRLECEFNCRVGAIRPPTVPPNTARLRITLTANHTNDDIEKLITAMAHCRSEVSHA